MIYNKNNLAVGAIASKTGLNPKIEGILFRKNMTVAINTYTLIEISTPATNRDASPINDIDTEPFIIPASDVKNFKLPATKNEYLNNAGVVKKDDQNKIVELQTFDGVMQTNAYKFMDGEDFPKYEQVIPQGEPVAELCLDIEQLADILKVMKPVSGKFNKVHIKLYGSEKPVVLTSTDGKQNARALIMPIIK